ncbi:MAG: NADH-quinone oxidoreductase subunit A [Acidobacteria bacterium]|jgi:NADH-quinone oxidoreductase subunit A|nr:MAG: NADH-quinone oxidoreductase subunit A [Acidobacteriota bacterium]GIU81449.1 MAG: NADH-quinone oxidoreductase subunit A 1 [Pyrinomonadaceae bacterium]
MFELKDYLPILVMFIVAVGFAASQIIATQLFGPKKKTATKLMPYECGKDPVGSARERFSVKFYNVAVDFLLFDIEVLFVVPFAVAFKSLLITEAATGIPFGTYAFVGILVFVAMIIAGLVYTLKKGVLDWSLQARLEARAEAKAMTQAERKARARAIAEGIGV